MFTVVASPPPYWDSYYLMKMKVWRKIFQTKVVPREILFKMTYLFVILGLILGTKHDTEI